MHRVSVRPGFRPVSEKSAPSASSSASAVSPVAFVAGSAGRADANAHALSVSSAPTTTATYSDRASAARDRAGAVRPARSGERGLWKSTIVCHALASRFILS